MEGVDQFLYLFTQLNVLNTLYVAEDLKVSKLCIIFFIRLYESYSLVGEKDLNEIITKINVKLQ